MDLGRGWNNLLASAEAVVFVTNRMDRISRISRIKSRSFKWSINREQLLDIMEIFNEGVLG